MQKLEKLVPPTFFLWEGVQFRTFCGATNMAATETNEVIETSL